MKRHTKAELDAAARADLEHEVKFAREQAKRGPFFPEKGITRDSLLAYADECERKLQDGYGHADAIRG